MDYVKEEGVSLHHTVEALGALRDGFRGLLAYLKKSVPFFSMRYQGHMNWDLTIPGVAGYFAAMLYNPNNVAFEGSTATTMLELLVGDDLCRMLGYTLPTASERDAGIVRPWGHITCDGTIANIEALWAARNLKYYPIALRAALLSDARLHTARHLTIRLPLGRSAELIDLESWQLLNLPADEVLAMTGRLTGEFNIPRADVSAAVNRFSLQSLGWLEFGSEFLIGVPAPVLFVPGSKHYSFPKAAAVLGLGARQLIDVAVDCDARLDLVDLRRRLEQCLSERRPVIAVVAVIVSLPPKPATA